MNEAIKEIIREKYARMTIGIEMFVDGTWQPLPGHGCTTDAQARRYVSRFTDPRCKLRIRPLAEVYPDVFSSGVSES